MRKLFAPLSLLFAFSFAVPPAPAIAQDDEQGDITYLITYDVAPGDREAFQAAAMKYVEAAKAAELSPDYSWAFWSHDRGYTLVWPLDSFAEFDDPQFNAQFEGTPGESLRDEAQAMFNNIQFSANGEVVENVDSWSYMPETPVVQQPAAAVVWAEWPKNGTQEAYGEMAEGWVTLMEEMGYPFQVLAHRNRIGDGSTDYVFFLNSVDEFYSDETWNDLIEANGLQSMRDALNKKHGELVKRYETFSAWHQADMSYWPAGDS